MDAKIERVQSAATMRRFTYVIAKRGIAVRVGLGAGLGISLAVVAACQRDAASTPPPAPTAPELYRTDIENLCDVIVKAGADRLDPGERPLVIANWLAAHFQTSEAHDYLIRIQPLTGEAKAAALEAEATRVGLPRCALAGEWRGPGQSSGS